MRDYMRGQNDARRMLDNGASAESLSLTTNDYLTRHPNDQYWQGIKSVLDSDEKCGKI